MGKEGGDGILAEVTGKSRVFCVIGHPVGHSLSPVMQNAALQVMGIDAIYVAFEVSAEALVPAVLGLEAIGVAGVNCTIPHKEAVVPLMDELSEDAAAIGAVNTIVFENGRRIGHNTDAAGFLASVRSHGEEPRGRRAVVLGAGGSARAVVTALGRAGAQITVANRTQSRAERLCAEVNGRLKRDVAIAVPLDEEALVAPIQEAALLVNTTSLGMSPEINGMPAVPMRAMGPHLFVYDLIYNPLETQLLRVARERGARGAHGAGMLARQGALALERWTGKQAPAELMESVIVDTLSQRRRSERGAAPGEPARG